jgi:RNA polymerase sigma factor (sigma-70 family)
MGEAMKDDTALLADYAANGSESAFEELVSRHAGLVYSAALRQVGKPGLAEEITQAVFCILARKAGSLGARTVVSGWLYRTTRFTSLKSLRSERRRAARELESHLMSADHRSSADPLANTAAVAEVDEAWEQMAPLVDEAMDALAEKDRDALILRFFDNLNLREVGDRLGISDDAAQKRVSRALERLRGFLSARGVGASVGVIALALPAKAVGAAPFGLTTTLTGIATSTTAGIGGATILTLTNETIHMIAWTKLKTFVPVALIGAFAVGTPLVVQQNSISDLRQENAKLLAKNQQLEKPVVITPAVDTNELEELRKEAAEVHRLRGEVARLRSSQSAAQTAVAAAETERVRMVKKLDSADAKRAAAEESVERGRERAAFQMKSAQMKRLGLAFHVAIQQGRLPANVDELVKMANLSADMAAELRAKYHFFDHSKTDPNTGGHPFVLADRLPTQTLDGDQIWSYTMVDGAALTLKRPPPADGVLRNIRPEERVRSEPGTMRQSRPRP